jgi:hypothetical protein
MLYFQVTGFEKMFLKNTFNCVKIRIISKTGYQYITSFSSNFPAENPNEIQEAKYLKTIALNTIIHSNCKDNNGIGKIKNNSCVQ